MRLPSFFSDLPKRTLAFEIAAAVILALLFWRGLLDGPLPKPTGGGMFDRWRAGIVTRVDDVFDPPASYWVAGLLLGVDQGFSPKWRMAFRRTGTSHLTAVSGYNVGVVLSAVLSALRFSPFGRRGRVIVALACVTGFVLLTGSPGSVLRSAVMIGALETSRLFGRPIKPLRALLIAALCIGILSPRSLAQDRGFQLSVLASFGLATLASPMTALFGFLPKTVAAWAGQTMAATLATAPLIAFISGTYSLVALPANLAVTAFIPMLMAGGAILIALSFVSLGFAMWCAGLTKGLFLLPLVVIHGMAAWPIAAVTGPAAFAALCLAEIGGLAYALSWRRHASQRYGLQE
jgi:competence protein ComEC